MPEDNFLLSTISMISFPYTTSNPLSFISSSFVFCSCCIPRCVCWVQEWVLRGRVFPASHNRILRLLLWSRGPGVEFGGGSARPAVAAVDDVGFPGYRRGAGRLVPRLPSPKGSSGIYGSVQMPRLPPEYLVLGP